MYIKMIFGDIKHTAKDYRIYLFTLILLVGIFYGFLSISSINFQKFFPAVYNVYQLQQIVKYTLSIITLLIIFLICYVNQYILKQKQQEFALLKLMGIKSNIVGLIFFIQTFIIGLIAIFLGCICGMFFSQVVAAIVLTLCHQAFEPFFTLFIDTVIITIVVFLLIFLLVGLINVYTISKMKIIDMLNANKKGEIKSNTKFNFVEIILSVIMSIYTFIYGSLAVFEGFKQEFSLNIIILAFISTIISLSFFLISIIYFYLLYKKNNIPIFLNLLIGILEIISGICTIVLFTFLHITDLYPIIAVMLIIFGIFTLFNCFSDFLLILRNHLQHFYYNHLFLFGQLTFKLRTNSHTMSVLAFVLAGAFIILSIAQPVAYTKSEYQKTRLHNEIVLKTNWFDYNTIDELPTSNLSFKFVEDYLNKGGYKIQNSLTIPYYFIDTNDFEKRNKQGAISEVVLGISVQSYNSFRQMMGLSKIDLDNNQFAIHMSKEFNQNTDQQYKSIYINSTVLQFSGYSNSDYMGEFFEGGYKYTIILPNSVCDYLTIAQFRYFCNTNFPLTYKFATQFSKDMAIKIDKDNIFKLGKGLSNIVTKTVEINEGFMWQMVLTLALIYIGIILMIMSFTILSLQLLIDSTEHKLRFEILSKLGVPQQKIRSIVIQQMMFWFGIPSIFALLTAFIICFKLYNINFLEMPVFISKDSFSIQVFSSMSIILLLLFCYFIITYWLFIKNIEKH